MNFILKNLSGTVIDALIVILIVVLVFGGPVGCIIKALLGIEQRRFLPKAFTDMYKD